MPQTLSASCLVSLIFFSKGPAWLVLDGHDLKLFIIVGWDRSFCLFLWLPGSTDGLLLLQISSGVVRQSRDR